MDGGSHLCCRYLTLTLCNVSMHTRWERAHLRNIEGQALMYVYQSVDYIRRTS
jgi:hypothetical protein